jgi:hypothetical protein
MFSFFKKKSRLELLQLKYKKILEESYKLSSINRKASDLLIAEANEILVEIEKIHAEK